MCRLCDEGKPQDHASSNAQRWNSRRGFLKAGHGRPVGRDGAMACSPVPAARADDDEREPEDSGRHGRRIVIRGGAVMSMDQKVGDFAHADVLIEGKKIVAVGPNLHAGGTSVIDARGRIVMPGFIDTHHHLVRDGAAQFPGRRVADELGSGSPAPPRGTTTSRSCQVCAGVPAAGRVHQRAVRRRWRNSTTA